ncbi:MAG: 3-hydroxy-3-methylglutaryl-CoA reductase, partial [Verrucomicrobiota bacterium]
MPTSSHSFFQHLERLLEGGMDLDDLAKRLEPKLEHLPPAFPGGARLTEDALAKRWKRLRSQLGSGSDSEAILLDAWTREHYSRYGANIENFVGTAKLPIGVIGPLRVNGLYAQEDYAVPLATTEAALVASYHRGARLLTSAGGCTSALLNESVNRAPAFAFRTLAECGRFVHWTLERLDEFREIVSQSSRYAQLIDVGFMGEGNHVYLNFQFSTGDAAG